MYLQRAEHAEVCLPCTTTQTFFVIKSFCLHSLRSEIRSLSKL